MTDRSFLALVSFLVRASSCGRSSRRPLRVLAIALVTQACAPSLGGAVRAYEHGRYPEAMDELRAVEVDAMRCGSSAVTRYALYRGLAHLGLGDVRAARHWLDRVERTMAVNSASLSADDAGRLASAWAHLPR
jgi:hypothetical protein